MVDFEKVRHANSNLGFTKHIKVALCFPCLWINFQLEFSQSQFLRKKGGGVLDLPTYPRLGLCVINHPKRNPEKKWKIGHCAA